MNPWWIAVLIAVVGFGTYGAIVGGELVRNIGSVLPAAAPLPSGVDGFPVHGRGPVPFGADRWATSGELCPCCGGPALVVYDMDGRPVGFCGRRPR